MIKKNLLLTLFFILIIFISGCSSFSNFSSTSSKVDSSTNNDFLIDFKISNDKIFFNSNKNDIQSIEKKIGIREFKISYGNEKEISLEEDNQVEIIEMTFLTNYPENIKILNKNRILSFLENSNNKIRAGSFIPKNKLDEDFINFRFDSFYGLIENFELILFAKTKQFEKLKIEFEKDNKEKPIIKSYNKKSDFNFQIDREKSDKDKIYFLFSVNFNNDLNVLKLISKNKRHSSIDCYFSINDNNKDTFIFSFSDYKENSGNNYFICDIKDIETGNVNLIDYVFEVVKEYKVVREIEIEENK